MARRRKVKDFTDDAVHELREGAHTVVDAAEDVFGKAKRKTRKARRRIDRESARAEKEVARIRKKAEKQASDVRTRAEKAVDKATKRLPGD